MNITPETITSERNRLAEEKKERERRDSMANAERQRVAKISTRPKVIHLLAIDQVEKAVDLAFENGIWEEVPFCYLKQYAEDLMSRDFNYHGSSTQYLRVCKIYEYKELADSKLASEAKAKANRIREIDRATRSMEVWERS